MNSTSSADALSDATAAPSQDICADDRAPAFLVYILYLAGSFIGLTAIAGLIMAYLNRGKVNAALDTHYDFQIKTFWIGLGLFTIGFFTTVLLVGWLVLLFWLVWTLVRVITGIQALSAGRAVADPASWGFKA